MLTLTDGFLKMMNFKYVFRWHLPFLFLVLFTCRAMAADTLLVLGDSLSAGYRMAAIPPGLRCLTISGRPKRRWSTPASAAIPRSRGWQGCRLCLSSISRAGCW
jgi:hypothetical protein